MKRGLLLIATFVLAAAPVRANTLAVVATSPATGTASVGVQATVTFTFNRPVDPEAIAESFLAEPAGSIALGDFEVSDDGHLVSVDVTHLPATDYTWIVSGTYQNLNDGTLIAIEPFVLHYSTSSALGAASVQGQINVRDGFDGDIRGRRLPLRFEVPNGAPLFKEMQRSGKERIRDGAPSDGQGMPTSSLVDPDPTGAVVILSAVNPLTSSGEEAIAGAAVVNGVSGVFSMPYLRPGTYYPYAMKVDVVDPNAPLGELLGAMHFGYYDPNNGGIPDAISVPAAGTVDKIDFSIAPLSYYAGTAGEMEVAARAAAGAYASDQHLAGITTFALGASGSAAAWTYNYYSPSTGLQTDVTVTPFDVEVIPMEYPGEVPPADLPLPFVDSDQAYVVGLINGGEDFLEEFPMAITGMAAGIGLETGIGSGPGTDGPYWAIAYLNLAPTRIDYLVVYVDFITGEFLGSERAEPIAGKYSDRFQEAIVEVSALNGSFMLVGAHADGATTDGVAAEWQFEFYAENTDTRAFVRIAEGHSVIDSESPAGRPDLMPLGGIIIDSDVAIAAAMQYGGSDFVDQFGMSRITLDAGDLSQTFPWLSDSPVYLVSIYGEGASGERWFRAALDPTTALLLHSEQSGGTASDPEAEIPSSIELGVNYPNPFNPQTTIPFEIASGGSARLTVHDALGRQVAVLLDGAMPTGSHEVSWDASTQPSGIYFYRLSAAGETATGKMILQK